MQQTILKKNLDLESLKSLFQTQLLYSSTNEEEVNFIYENISEILTNESSSDSPIDYDSLLNIINRYIKFEDKELTRIELKNILMLNSSYELFFKNKRDNNNCITLLLNSPYLNNVRKNILFEKIKNNLELNNKQFTPLPFLIDFNSNSDLKDTNIQSNMYLIVKKIKSYEDMFADNIFDYSVPNIEHLIFTLEKNRDKKNLLLLTSGLIVFLRELEDKSSTVNKDKEKHLLLYEKDFVYTLINKLLISEFCSINIDSDILHYLEEIITIRESFHKKNNKINDISKQTLIILNNIKTNFNCNIKYNIFNHAVNSKSDFRELINSKNAVSNTLINKNIFKYLIKLKDIQDISPVLEIENSDMGNILKKYNFSKEEKNYNYNYSKYLHLITHYNENIIQKNRKFIDLIKKYTSVLNDSIPTNINIIFDYDFKQSDNIEIINVVNKTIREINKKIENKEDAKETLFELSLYIKNPFLMKFLFVEDKTTYENVFNTFYKTLNDKGINYNYKDMNLLELEKNEENRTFLKQYISNIIKTETLNIFFNEKPIYETIFDKLIEKFIHLETKFNNIISEAFIELKDYGDLQNNTNSESKEYSKFYFYNSLLKNISNDIINNDIGVDLEKDIEVIKEIVKKNKINFNF